MNEGLAEILCFIWTLGHSSVVAFDNEGIALSLMSKLLYFQGSTIFYLINIAMVKGNNGRGQFILFLQSVFANNQIHSGYNQLVEKLNIRIV